MARWQLLFCILCLSSPVSIHAQAAKSAAPSAWTSHPQYVVIQSMDDKKEEPKETKEATATKNKKARTKAPEPTEEEYYDDYDDDFMNFEPPSAEEMQDIFASLSQVFGMNDATAPL